jgi:molecular chaperone GrpE
MAKTQQEETELERRLKAEIAEEELDAVEAEVVPDGETPAEDEANAEAPPVDCAAELEGEVVALTDQLLRGRAEFDNYRKRVARDNERVRKLAAQGVITDLLPIVDNLDLALQHKDDATGGLWEGVEMVSRQLTEIMAAWGLEAIVAEGAPFDPNVHEAVAQVPSEELSEGQVVQEFQRGYRMGDQVLRPSKVTVSSGSVNESAEDE